MSSVYDNDRASYGKSHLFDNDINSCWNSNPGFPQFVDIEFTSLVTIHEFGFVFQGGFAAKTLTIESMKDGALAKTCDMECENSNYEQVLTSYRLSHAVSLTPIE